jgi:hypothetical protein
MSRSLVVGLTLLGMLLLLPLASGSVIPVPPAPLSYPVQQALGAATNGSYGMYETFQYSQTITTPHTSVACGSATCQQLHDAWANVSSPFPRIGKEVSAETWVNTTVSCSPYVCPQGFFQCGTSFYDYQSGTSLALSEDCLQSGVLWLTGVSGQVPPQDNTPTYNITHRVGYLVSALVLWVPSGPYAVTNLSVSSPSPSAVAPATEAVQGWQIPSVALAVSLPPHNTWVPAHSTFFWTNQSVYLINWTMTSAAFIAQWVEFPTGTNESYTLSAATLTAPPNLGGFGSGNRTGTTPPPTTPSSLTLGLGNFTSNSNGSETGYTEWVNPYTLGFNGSIVLSASGLSGAIVYTVYDGATPLPSNEYVVGAGIIEILPGVVPVAAGNAIHLSVSFLPISGYGPASPLASINGILFNGTSVMVLLGLVLSFFYYLYKQGKDVVFGIAGIMLMFISVGVVLLVP